MQHTATTKQHSSDNIEPWYKHLTFVKTFFCRTRPALGVPRLPTIERAALQPRATSCPVLGQHSEHLPFCEAPVRKFLPGPPGAIHGPCNRISTALDETIPSANETVTTMLSQVSRVRHLNQTFCTQIMLTSKHVHRQSLSFPCCPPRTKAATLCTATSKSTAIPSHPMQHKKKSKMYIVTAIITLTSTKATEINSIIRYSVYLCIIRLSRNQSLQSNATTETRTQFSMQPFHVHGQPLQSMEQSQNTISKESMQDHIHRRKMSRVLLSRHLCIHLRLRPNDSFVEDAVECRSHRLVR